MEQRKRHLVVLSGAGISKESGLSTFRDKDGLWAQHDAMEMASIGGYRRNRARVLDFYNERRRHLLDVEPNHAHRVLAELERDFAVTIVTQNVDDLHERAGSTSVVHLHGELRKVTSSNNPNGAQYVAERPLDLPIRVGDKAADGSQLRPYIVLFGEPVPMMAVARRAVRQADVFVVIGTSLAVYPAASLIDDVPRRTPSFVVDPADFADGQLHGFEHIRATAVEGIDLLRERLAALAGTSEKA